MLGSNENFEPATGYNNKTTRERAPREHVSGYDDVVLVDGLYILNALD
jgi:hypothetical protein